MISKLPNILLYSRLLLAFIILYSAIFLPDNAKIIVLILMYVGVLTDIFDGIIARKYNISTEKLRVRDTIIDLLFYLSILFFVLNYNPHFIYDNKFLLIIILFLEFLMYSVSLLRFKKVPSPHAILSKFWGIYIIIEMTLILLNVPGIHFTIALMIGIIVHLDRLMIYILLKKWEHDIPTCIQAYKLRKGKEIKKMKLFNG